MTRKQFALLAGIVLSMPAAATSGEASQPVRVTIHDHTFEPRTIHVKAGQQIVWLNTDQDPHTVTSGANNLDDGRWESSDLIADGQTFTLRINRPGTYPYFCKPHEYEESMHGTIVVSR